MEGGVLPSRIEYIEEVSTATVPDNPAWEMPSERVAEFDPGYSLNFSEDAGLGHIDWSREPTVEETEVSINYALQRWILDTNGNLQDMSAYGTVRASSNMLPSSLSIVRRVSSGDVNPEFANAPLVEPSSTINARYNPNAAGDGSNSTARVTRVYDVIKGAAVGETTLTADREETAVMADLSMPARHGRSYQVDQPTAATNLEVFSQDAADTDFVVHVEDEGNATGEDIPLDAADATTPVSSTNAYDNLDVVEISDPNGNIIDEDAQDYAGPIVVKTSGTAATAGWLTAMWGSNDYSNTYSDPGIPALGTGSHASPISATGEHPTYYDPQNARIERPVGEVIEHAGGVSSVEMSISNNIERTPTEAREQLQTAAMRGVETTVTMDGETVSAYFTSVMRRANRETTRLLLNNAQDEYLDNQSAVATDAGRSDSAGEVAAGREVTLAAQRGPDNESALDVSNAGSGAP